MPATAKKTIFDRIEDKVRKEEEAKVKQMNRANVMRAIQKMQLNDNQIIELLNLPLAFVQTIRQEMNPSK